jgi:cytidylate kinase
MTSGAADAFRELRLRQELPELGRAVVAEAARRPGVILASAAFAALQEHPTAIHVRLRAPLEWRIESYRRHRLVDRACAEKAVKHDDHVKRAWVKTLYHVDIDDPSWFSLVVDVSRFSPDRVVETMLAAAGVEAAELAL